MKMILHLILLLSLFLFFAFAIAFFLLNSQREKIDKCRIEIEKLPRNRTLGVIFAWIALLWCYPNLIPLFDSSSPLQSMILPFLIIVGFIVSFFADFLFARAFAAILILDSHTLLKWIYPLNLPGYPFLAFLILSFGLMGIVIAAKPYWIRKWFQKSFNAKWVRIVSSIYFLILALSMSILEVEVYFYE